MPPQSLVPPRYTSPVCFPASPCILLRCLYRRPTIDEEYGAEADGCYGDEELTSVKAAFSKRMLRGWCGDSACFACTGWASRHGDATTHVQKNGDEINTCNDSSGTGMQLLLQAHLVANRALTILMLGVLPWQLPIRLRRVVKQLFPRHALELNLSLLHFTS